MIVLKDKDLPSVNEEFASLSPLQAENHLTFYTGNDYEIKQEYQWVENISYVDSEKQEHIISVIQCLDQRPYKKTNKQRKFKWITNFNISKRSGKYP